MKTSMAILIIVLVLVGVVVSAAPLLTALYNPPQPAAPTIPIGDPVCPQRIACFPPPCDCDPNC